MHICVVSGFHIGSNLAHAINTIKMAEGFSRIGNKVTVICRKDYKENLDKNIISEHYGLSADIEWIQLSAKCSDIKFSLLAIMLILRNNIDLIFARHYIVPSITSILRIPTVVETHAHLDNYTLPFRGLIKASSFSGLKLLVTISHVLAENYIYRGVPKNKIAILPDAVDLQLFIRPNSLPTSPYDNNKFNVVYAGHLYDYKGIPTILEAAKLLPHITFHLVGGLPDDLIRQKLRAEELNLNNVIFHGAKPHAKVPNYLWHANVLLLPPSNNHPSARWTSPVKLGEYLASNVPTIATSIPALKDWLNKDEVHFVEPDDACSLASGIMKIYNDEIYAKMLQTNAAHKVLNFSYEKRAEKILANIKKYNVF